MKCLKNSIFLTILALFANQAYTMEIDSPPEKQPEKFAKPNAVIKFTNKSDRSFLIIYKKDTKEEKSALAPGKTFTINTYLTKTSEWDYSDLIPYQGFGAKFKEENLKIIDTQNNKIYSPKIEITRLPNSSTVETELFDIDTEKSISPEFQQIATNMNTQESFNIEYILGGKNLLDSNNTEIEIIIMQNTK